MVKVPSGGPANINGVLLQMLWSLLRAARLNASRCVADESTGQVAAATLILEPIGGGGDLQEIGTRRVVEQVKASPGDGTWSLAVVIQDVIPDLYLAIDDGASDTAYRFVTEGRIGRWLPVYRFFQSLSERRCPEGDASEGLDELVELKFGGRRGSNALWRDGVFTERSLFALIVAEVRKRKPVGDEPIELTRRKLWRLLGHFEFLGEQKAGLLLSQIDRLLKEVVGDNTTLVVKRDAMLLDLARRAATGGAIIDTSDFFADHGLNATRLTDLARLRESARGLLERQLVLSGYRPADDVRGSLIESTVTNWDASRPIMVLSGESGQGKSWLLSGIARAIAAEGEIVVVRRSTGDAATDLQRAADAYWQDVKGHDNSLPLGRIAARAKEVVADLEVGWLTILLDDVRTPNEARELGLEDWERHRIKLALSCSPEVAETFRRVAGGRCHFVKVGDFARAELATYLENQLGEGWIDIPADVRETLRRPLLAALYRDEAQLGHWRPANEYELYARYWGRLREDEQAGYPSDVVGISRLTLSVLLGEPYPWDEQQVGRELCDEAVTRLCRVGWFRRLPEGRLEIWHERLLNWALAEALVSSARRGDLPDFGDHVRDLFISGHVHGGRMLGYVPMDVLWLLSAPAFGADRLLDRAIESLEGVPRELLDGLFTRLIPTLGARVVPALGRRLEAATLEDPFLARAIGGGLAAIESPIVLSEAVRLLTIDSPLVQRAAMRLLARRPTASVLDRLWTIHCKACTDSGPFQRRDKSYVEANVEVYLDTFNALRSCVRVIPDGPAWLERAIRQADPAQPVHDLAYLLGNLNDSDALWRRCKPILYEKIPTGRERSLAHNILLHRDEEEIGWLQTRIHDRRDLVGPVSLWALSRIRPELAIAELTRLTPELITVARDRCIPGLLVMQPEVTRAGLLELLRGQPSPWTVADVYEGNENALDIPTLEFLLDALERSLDADDASLRPTNFEPLYLPFRLLGRVSRLDLVEQLGRRCGSSLEQKLTEWLLRVDLIDRGVARREGMKLLRKMGGEGLTKLINRDLASPSFEVRRNAISMAPRRPDRETGDLLAGIAASDRLMPDGYPFEQGEATRALASIGRWSEAIASVVRWSKPFELEPGRGDAGSIIDDATLGLAFEALRRETGPTPGAVFALAIGGRRDLLSSIRSILDTASPDSELALACVVALGLLGDGSDEAVASLILQLSVRPHRLAARVALVQVGTEAALIALLDSLRDDFDAWLAAVLLHSPPTRDAAESMVRGRLRSAPESMRLELLTDLSARVDDATLKKLVDAEELLAFLHEKALDERTSRFGGAMAAVIRALAQFDVDAALLAARKVLRDPAGGDRGHMPYLMLEIDRQGATPHLIEQAAVERSAAVTWSIGRSLSGVQTDDLLLFWLASVDPVRRRAACCLAGRVRTSFDIEAALLASLDDLDAAVAEEAQRSLKLLREATDVEALVAAVISEREEARRWVLVDCLLELADPGDGYGPAPDWCRDLEDTLPRAVQEYLRRQLVKRREEQDREAVKADRSSSGR